VGDAHEHLLRAQNIITELRSALNFDTGEIAVNLDRSYEYLHHLLVQANVKKDTSLIGECVGHLRGLRDTWEEVFRRVDAEAGNAPAAAPRINQHGNSVMNIKG
jgi:flagellar protein FliS